MTSRHSHTCTWTINYDLVGQERVLCPLLQNPQRLGLLERGSLGVAVMAEMASSGCSELLAVDVDGSDRSGRGQVIS